MGSPGRLFLSTRGVTSGMALVLALYYTKLLGVEKRSILVFIMVTALILTVIFTSGISLTFRNRPAKSIQSEDLTAYLSIIILGGLLVALLNCILLVFYSQLKSEIPLSIYIISFIYSFLACVNLGFQDALIAKGNLKLATFLDFTTIVIQGLCLVFFVFLDQTSLFMSVTISFAISYLLIVFATITVFIQTETMRFKGLGQNVKTLLRSSKQNQLFGIANGMADRIDRFLIGFLLPLAFLAKYALITSMISFTRFFPEAFNRLLLIKHHQVPSFPKKELNLRAYVLISGAVIGFVFLSQFLVLIVFGDTWLLPINVVIIYAIQEVLRGFYQTKATKLVAEGKLTSVSQSSLLLIIGSIVFMLIGISFFGLVGAPLAMVFVYAILIKVLNYKLRVPQ
jgi:O-antigen/teichoic acid export membrane protein